MSRIVYLNGQYIAEEDAKISVFDRGFLFADGVYEGLAIIEGKLVDFDAHIMRLHRSLDEMRIKEACSDADILTIFRALIEKNNIKEGFMYLQITRGIADRDFVYPDDATPSTLFAFTQEKNLIDTPLARTGAKIITLEDQRWSRRDLKTIQLVSQSMAKMEAKRNGADDAWLVDGIWVNEGTASNAFIITHSDIIVTRDLSNKILHGITRAAILAVAKTLNLKIEERPFTIEEAINAKEAFITGSSSLVCPVVEINGQPIGTGKPEEIVKTIRSRYIDLMKKHST